MAFLDVEYSLTGRTWEGPGPEVERLGLAMAQQTGLPEPLCRVMARLGVSADGAEKYLRPQLRDLLPDPRSMRDMEVATRRFLAAVKRREKIAVFGDYDVDGGSSAALLLVWLRAMGREATLYIPDRIDEGYGPNVPAMQALARDHDLIICVDCGTLSFEPIAAARDNFVDVGLMAGVPQQSVGGGVEHAMKGHGQLDSTQVRTKVSAGDGHLFDDELAYLRRQLIEFGVGECAQVPRFADALEMHAVLTLPASLRPVALVPEVVVT